MATRIHYVLLAAAAILLMIGIAHQHDQVRGTIQKAWKNKESHGETPAPTVNSPVVENASIKTSPLVSSSNPLLPHVSSRPHVSSSPDKLPSFLDIAKKYGTDKVTDHQYWFIYDKYLPAIRNKKVKMLEIGLGCNMNYGPGASYYTWLEYFPDVDLYFMEYDAECAAKWAGSMSGATIFTGDQADVGFLERVVAETGGGFDVVVDDGGHTMAQQRTSLEGLWRAVRPGGLYVVEDLQTSYMAGYGGDESGGRDPAVPTMAKFLYELIDDKLQPDGTRHLLSSDVRGIECQREVCALFKKEAGSI